MSKLSTQARSKTSAPAKATVERIASTLSYTSGRTASGIANEAGVSPSTARKCLTVLKERGEARRDHQTADWFAVVHEEPEVEGHEVVSTKVYEEGEHPHVLAGTKVVTLKRVTDSEPTDDERDSAIARDHGAGTVLASWGLSPRLVAQDGELYELLRDCGPLSRSQLETKLSSFSEWSLRRLSTATHRGEVHGDPLIEAVGRGDDRVYRVIES